MESVRWVVLNTMRLVEESELCFEYVVSLSVSAFTLRNVHFRFEGSLELLRLNFAAALRQRDKLTV